MPPEPHALHELSDWLAQLDAAQIGRYQLYEQLTGPAQLYWRCCQDAIRSRPGWFRQAQHRRTLELVRSQEQPQSDGAVCRAAEAVSWISQAVAADDPMAAKACSQADCVGDGDSPHALLARAAGNWSSSQAWPSPNGTVAFPSAASLAAIHPAMRERTEQTLRWLCGSGVDTGSAMAAICLLMLAGATAHTRRLVRVPVVLADRRSYPAKGVPGVLELSEFPAGPPGLFPDPAALMIMRTDALFGEALRLAWEFADGQGICVLWRLTLDTGGPAAAVDGASMGAAFAVALHALLRRGPASGPRPLTGLRGFFLGLRPRCAITGVIFSPPAHEETRISGTGHAGQFQLAAVGHLDAKIQAAHSKNWRLVAPEANQRSGSPRVPEAMHVDWARTVRQADRFARRVRPIRTFLAILSAMTLIGISIFVALVINYRDSVDYQRGIIASGQAAQESILLAADSEHTSDDILAAQFAAAAWQAAPTAQARESMLRVLSQPERATLKAADDGQEATMAAFSPDGEILATGGADGTLRLWNVATERQIGKSVTISQNADHRVAVNGLAFSGHILAVGDQDGTLRLWNTATRRQIGAAYNIADGANVNELAFSPRGNILAIAVDNATAVLWDVATHQQVGLPIVGAGGADVATVALSPDGRILATGGGTGTVRLWNVLSHQQVGSVIVATDGGNSVTGVAFNPTGNILATNGGGSARLWDVSTHHQVGRSMEVGPGGGSAGTVAFNTNGTVLATADGDNTARLWNVATQQQIGGPLVASTGAAANAVAFSPDSGILATAGDDGTVRLWDTALYQQIGAPFVAVSGPNPSVDQVAFNPGGTLLATAGSDGNLRLWDVASHRPAGPPIPAADSLDAVAFSPAGGTVATGSGEGTVSLWNVATLQREGQPIVAVKPGPGHNSDVFGVAFSPGGQVLATAGADGEVKLWNVATHRLIGSPISLGGQFGNIGVNAVAFSPDGRILATASSNGTAELWNVATHHAIGPVMEASSDTNVLPIAYDVVFSPDGRMLATASDDGTARLWSISTHREFGPPITVGGSVESVAFIGGTILATDSGDSVQLWDTATSGQIGSFDVASGSQGVTSLVFTAKRRILATGALDGTARLWDVSLPSNLFQQVCAIAGGPLSHTQWHSSVPSDPYLRIC